MQPAEKRGGCEGEIVTVDTQDADTGAWQPARSDRGGLQAVVTGGHPSLGRVGTQAGRDNRLARGWVVTLGAETVSET